MKLYTTIAWLFSLIQLLQSEQCNSKYFRIRKGLEFLATPKETFLMKNGIYCNIKCTRMDYCHCSNVVKSNDKVLCKLFDNKCDEESKIIENNEAIIYSVVSDNSQSTGINTTTTPTPMVNPQTSENISPAVACQKIHQENPSSPDGPYVVFPETEEVFCDMTGTQTGCGGGGWTLVMKISGSNSLFEYDSSEWTSTALFNPSKAVDLGSQQTKARTYYNTKFTQICLGMSYNNIKGWTIINVTGPSLYDLISSASQITTTHEVQEWKGLIAPATGQTALLLPECPKQGINVVKGDTGVRIGIIASVQCGSPSDYNSRLGFGGKGSSCGQDQTNWCGNEARCYPGGKTASFKTFGYILVK